MNRLPAIALSVQQPWTWLIIQGYKPVENRTWATTRREPIALHAGLKFDLDGYEWVQRAFPEIPLPKREEFERGGIVGTVNLVGCVTRHDSPFFFGPNGLVLRDPRPIPFRPCRGMLGFFRHSLEA